MKYTDKRTMQTFYAGNGRWVSFINLESYNYSDPEQCRYWVTSKKPTKRTVRKWKKAVKHRFIN